ncbi:MAG: hypothetical protein KGI75_11660 [Rhizobiaceae bacterium]|nr:hypothetical protein [Rhizobiaceae bacterium]
MRFPTVCVLTLVVSAHSAFATDAVSYSGTIGSLPVIMELASPNKDGVQVGRYAYLSKGVDIPLHVSKDGGDGLLKIEEEKPCTDKICKTSDDDAQTDAPIAAEWSLKIEKAGSGVSLTGSWQDKQSGKKLAVNLVSKGTRTLPDADSPFDALDPTYSTGDSGNPSVINSKELPYDFLKIAQPLKQGAVETIGDASYSTDEDARIGVSYPRIIKLGNVDPSPLNAYLTQQRLQFEMPAFSCLSKAYLGFGWSGTPSDGTGGYDGGGSVTVEYLTSRLIGLSEGGSLDCGGAHPDNFLNHRLADARSGKALVPESLLRGWVAKNADGVVVDPTTASSDTSVTYGPSDELVQYVKNHREKFDNDTETECGIDDLVGTNLGVYFTPGKLVFTLQDLPYAIFACGNDLVTIPLKDARPLLTEAGAKYFAELDQ